MSAIKKNHKHNAKKHKELASCSEMFKCYVKIISTGSWLSILQSNICIVKSQGRAMSPTKSSAANKATKLDTLLRVRTMLGTS